MFEKIKYYYELGLWDINRVWNVVEKNAITEEEYKEITGFSYPIKA
ncbi:XkdX family protein [Clostridium tertium]|nr:XkdX family protein [Clostridium tertium]MDB1923406.1 XkdX family protein [Clostridium tertium]MDB1930011.1 XkdX family protein [Clostridium tertium]